MWFLTVTCSCCPYLYFGSTIMWVTYLGSWRPHVWERAVHSVYFPFGFEGRIWDLNISISSWSLLIFLLFLSRRGLVNQWKGHGFTDLFIDLRSEHDKSVYFWSWGSYLLYNAIGTWKIAKNYIVFPSKRGNLQSAILFMLSTAAAIITQTKPYEISAVLIHSVFSSFCLFT